LISLFALRTLNISEESIIGMHMLNCEPFIDNCDALYKLSPSGIFHFSISF